MVTKNSTTFFDYELALRQDLKFVHKLKELAAKQAQLQNLCMKNPKYKKELQDTIMQILRLTNFNLSPLLGYYFPRYPRTTPFSLKNFPYAYAMFNLSFGRDAVVCIKGSRQIAKTTCLGVRNTLALQLFNGLSILGITPRSEQLLTLANKYKEIDSAYRFSRNAKNLRKNLYYKEFPNKSSLKFEYILENVDKIRGNSMDWLDYDEYQDFDTNLELEIEETITQSPMPMITKTGTSKTIDTALEATYETTSRSLWRMTCSACNHDNYPTLEHNVMDMIQPKGVCCAKCSTPLRIRDGQWAHQSPQMLEAGRIGLHVPKIIVPENTENPHKWWPIYQQSQSKNRKKFLEEVLGIATNEGAREITSQELEDVCILGSRANVLDRARRGEYHYIISGCDWGGSDYVPAHKTKQSYTVHAMVGVDKNWNFDILYFEQFSGMDYEEIASQICQTHKEFNCFALASDFGVGAVYNNYLRKMINPHRHVIFNYSGNTREFISESPNAHMYNQLTLNKTESITTIFNDIKNKRIRCFNWGESQEYLKQFTNLIRNPTDEGRINYRRHGARPDDALHAVNFAVQLAKLVIGETAFEDEAVKEEILSRFNANEMLIGQRPEIMLL